MGLVRRQLSVISCQIGQLSEQTTVSGPTVSGNCKCFPGIETTVRSYSFRADNCKILQFPLAIAKSDRFWTKKNGTSSGQIKILRPLLKFKHSPNMVPMTLI